MSAASYFLSDVVRVTQHRTRPEVCVARVRDSLQTYISDISLLKACNDKNTRTCVQIFAHGTRIKCRWSSLGEVVRQHLLLCVRSSDRSEEDSDEALVVVTKYNQLISFGVALAAEDKSLRLSDTIDIRHNSNASLLLTRHPPILRHLIDTACTIVEWHGSQETIGKVQVDCVLHTCNIHCKTVAPTNDRRNRLLLETFAQDYCTSLCKMRLEKLGSKVRFVTAQLSLVDETDCNDQCKVFCTGLSIGARENAVSVELCPGRAAMLCAKYNIPAPKVIIYNCLGGIDHYVNAKLKRETLPITGCEKAYNAQNNYFFGRLMISNGKKQMPLFSDSQALQIMKVLQRKCDQHCTRSGNNSEQPCSGFAIYFNRLSSIQFLLPSLFYLLKPRSEQAIVKNK